MKRANRLRKGAEFDATYEKGAVIHGPLLVVRYRPNHVGRNRWGFAVGKKLLKSAVDRNRMRRRLREACREIEEIPGGRLATSGGWDIIVTLRARGVGASAPDLAGALSAVVARFPAAEGASRGDGRS